MLLKVKVNKRWTDLKKVQHLLRENAEINDIIGAKRYNIYFVHQRVADLRRKGWIIKSVLTQDKKVKTYQLIGEPLQLKPQDK